MLSHGVSVIPVPNRYCPIKTRPFCGLDLAYNRPLFSVIPFSTNISYFLVDVPRPKIHSILSHLVPFCPQKEKSKAFTWTFLQCSFVAHCEAFLYQRCSCVAHREAFLYQQCFCGAHCEARLFHALIITSHSHMSRWF